MKIRKLIAAFLSVVLIVCMFYGCGNDKNMDEKSNVTQGESSKDTTQANTEMSNKTEEDTTASSEVNTLTEESSEPTQQQTPPSQFSITLVPEVTAEAASMGKALFFAP